MRDRTRSSNRVAISNGCAAVGVLLLVLAGVSTPDWYPVVQFSVGVGLIAVSHVLTPCRDQITPWWSARLSKLWRRKSAR